MDWIEQTIPYEGRVECYGAEESMYHHLNVNLEDINVDVRMDEDGEMRTLGIEGTLELKMAVYQEETVEFFRRCIFFGAALQNRDERGFL